ncbi:MAG: hypothetical protein GY721_11330 [Deltaproteobacteria bacterium]|nr:hypothetical protein [Deltaproteobacteria bacterium]
MRRKVEIEDSLDERISSAFDDVKEALLEWLDENRKGDVLDEIKSGLRDDDDIEVPCLSNDLDYSGRVHEIVDGSVPIYTSEIEDTWYLHSQRLEEAYENAGVGENPRENNGMVAIYYAIHEGIYEQWESEAQDVCNNWYEELWEEHNPAA